MVTSLHQSSLKQCLSYHIFVSVFRPHYSVSAHTSPCIWSVLVFIVQIFVLTDEFIVSAIYSMWKAMITSPCDSAFLCNKAVFSFVPCIYLNLLITNLPDSNNLSLPDRNKFVVFCCFLIFSCWFKKKQLTNQPKNLRWLHFSFSYP